MPQMAPISWTILFLIFFFSFIIFNMINFFNKNFLKIDLKKNNKSDKNNVFTNWKW